MNKSGLKKNRDNTNQKQVTNDEISRENIKEPFTSAQFQKVKDISEPSS